MDPAARYIERSLVLVKPDGVKRGLVGEIIHRFERAGLKIIGMKMVWIDQELASKHYPDAWIEAVKGRGEKTLASYEKYGIDAQEHLGTSDALEIGKMVNKWNREFLSSGPVIAMVLEGIHAIENVRMMVGNTFPLNAVPGTIRGDYSIDAPSLANSRKRVVRNLMHASGNAEEAKYELDLWFKPEELHDYKRTDQDIMFE